MSAQVVLREVTDLIVPWRHDSYVQRHRAIVIIARIRVISAFVALLIPLWVVVDALAFEPSVWAAIVPLRLASAAVFVALAWPKRYDDPRPVAAVLLVVALLVPPIFYLLSAPIISTADPNGFSGVVRNLYEYLPYTVVAGLSIFPLTALEVLICCFAVSVSLISIKVLLFHFDWVALAGPLWLLLLIGGAAMVSGMSQLQYMIALVRRVTFDALTGALCRRAGSEMLGAQFRRCLQNGLPLTLGFVDVDHFKQVNDAFGHDAGDLVLRTIALQLQRGLRQGDVLVRWGGEEFLVVLAATDKDGARSVINRWGAIGFGERPDGAPVTASFGLAERLVDDLKSESELIELADRRMYEAKLSGRNCAMFSHGNVMADVIARPGPTLR